MRRLKPGDYTGHSDIGIAEALQNALDQAGDYTRIEVVETCGSHVKGTNRRYQVTVATFTT